MSTLFPAEPADEEARLQALYDRLAARFGLGPAAVRISRRKLTGGEIRYGTPHTITISAHLSDGERLETLLHEAAHAWAFARRGARAGHGPLFQRLARQLGAKGGARPGDGGALGFPGAQADPLPLPGCSAEFRRFRPFRGTRHCVACHRAGRPSRLRRVTG